jgi:coiled-coil domain-containing protein 63/114
MRDLMRLKETEKSELERITLNADMNNVLGKSEGLLGSSAAFDDKRKSKQGWST